MPGRRNTRTASLKSCHATSAAVLADLQAGLIRLDRGAHDSREDGHCAMETVAWLAGEDHTDAPRCASPVLARYTIRLNDRWTDEQRQAVTDGGGSLLVSAAAGSGKTKVLVERLFRRVEEEHCSVDDFLIINKKSLFIPENLV